MVDSRAVQIDGHKRIWSIAFEQDDKRIVTGGEEGVVRVWDVKDGREVGEAIRVGNGGLVCAVALSKDRKWIVSGGGMEASVWDGATHEKVASVQHSNWVITVDVSPDSSRFATGSEDNTACIWDIKTGRKIMGPLQHDNYVGAVRFSPGGDRLATATWEKESLRIYNSFTGDLIFDTPVFKVSWTPTTPLVWSRDGKRIFAVSFSTIKCIDAYTGSILSERKTHGHINYPSIALSYSGRFIVFSARKSISLWDISTHTQIGSMLYHDSQVHSIAISHNDCYLASGEENGKITIRKLKDILPWHYYAVDRQSFVQLVLDAQLPLVNINSLTLRLWAQDRLIDAEAVMTEDVQDNPSHHTFANRALVRARLNHWSTAYEDALKSIEIRRSPIGHIAKAVALVGNNDVDGAMQAFDLAFTCCDQKDSNYLLLIKSMLLFIAGKRQNALSRVQDLVFIEYDKDLYHVIQAHMHILEGDTYLQKGELNRAVELFECAWAIFPSNAERDPRLYLISLIFDWTFTGIEFRARRGLCDAFYGSERIQAAAEAYLMTVDIIRDGTQTSTASSNWLFDFKQKCIAKLESSGNSAANSADNATANAHYSTALSLEPASAVKARLLEKRGKARLAEHLWDAALRDADRLLILDFSKHHGYELKHAALVGLERYGEAISAFNSMLSAMRNSPDEETRQLVRYYVSQEETAAEIDTHIRDVLQSCPLVLIDVITGHLCDAQERIRIFKSEKPYEKLASSITTQLDHGRIRQTVARYFQYTMFSHVWQGKEPTFQDVNLVTSIWNLPLTPMNIKLQKFCEMVKRDGSRWCWSDTCCIDKTISTVLNQSVTSMHRWYASSAVTIVILADVKSPSQLGDLRKSLWMTRAWTGQELLFPKVVRFYTQDWKPYLDDNCGNHKASPVILAELAEAINIAAGTITSFDPRNLGVREKLRLASMRKAMIAEDIAYSLIGMMESDVIPRYGEGGEAALGHLLEEVVARTSDVTVLAWTGTSSGYNSALPSSLTVYNQTPHTTPMIDERSMESEVVRIQSPSRGFGNHHLQLPCIVFPVQAVQSIGTGVYRATISVLGAIDIITTATLPEQEPRSLVLVHPWISDLLDRTYQVGKDQDNIAKTWADFSLHRIHRSNSTDTSSAPVDDDHTLALRLIVHLLQPFSGLLLEQKSRREYVRVAADREIIVRIPAITSCMDIQTFTLDIM